MTSVCRKAWGDGEVNYSHDKQMEDFFFLISPQLIFWEFLRCKKVSFFLLLKMDKRESQRFCRAVEKTSALFVQKNWAGHAR